MTKKADFDDEVLRICEMFSKVVAIYEEAGGEPEVKPPIECPVCLKETTGYACAWEVNKHVHFCCEHCESYIRQ